MKYDEDDPRIEVFDRICRLCEAFPEAVVLTTLDFLLKNQQILRAELNKNNGKPTPKVERKAVQNGNVVTVDFGKKGK